MFYDKPSAAPRGASRKIRLSSFRLNTDTDARLLSPEETPRMTGLSAEGGVLQAAAGVQPLFENAPEFFEDDAKLYYYRRFDAERAARDDKLVFYRGKDLPFAYLDLYGEDRSLKQVDLSPFLEAPSSINYRLDGEDVIILSSPQDSLAVWNGAAGAEIVSDAPRINSMCVHYERLFATDAGEGTRLWFSDDLDPRNWSVSLDEAGFIELVDLKGKLLRAISFLDYVYVFRTYGISRVTAYGDQTQFAVHELFTSPGRICAKSIAPAGDRILFLSDYGLHSFDGLAASRVKCGAERLLARADLTNLCACFFGGTYYAALYSPDYPGEAGRNNLLFAFDTERGRVSLTAGVEITDMAVLALDEGETLAVLYRAGGVIKTGKIVPGAAPEDCREYCSPPLDFGEPTRKKLVKKLSLFTDGDLTVTATGDGGTSKTVELLGKAGAQEVVFNLVCRTLELQIRPKNGRVRAGDLTLTAEVL